MRMIAIPGCDKGKVCGHYTQMGPHEPNMSAVAMPKPMPRTAEDFIGSVGSATTIPVAILPDKILIEHDTNRGVGIVIPDDWTPWLERARHAPCNDKRNAKR